MSMLYWLVGLVLSLPFYANYAGTPLPYRYMPCAGRAWKRHFPAQSNDHIRVFLRCFTDGMAFAPADKLRFAPHDKVLHVYRAIYGGRTPLGDCLECETFLQLVSERFPVSLTRLYDVWHEDVTLGELYAEAEGIGQTSAVGCHTR